jgi:hypothetical protein
MKAYLDFRPPLEIGGRNPLFYTDFGIRRDRKTLHRMFSRYKKRLAFRRKVAYMSLANIVQRL